MSTMISRLRAARAWAEERRGTPYTNAEFARGLAVEQASVNYWNDRQEGDLKAVTVFKAADFLGIDARWLAMGEGSMLGPKKSENKKPDVIVYSNGIPVALVEFKSHMPGPNAKQLAAWESMFRAAAIGVPDKLFEIVSDIAAVYVTAKDGNMTPSTGKTEPSKSEKQAEDAASAAKKKVGVSESTEHASSAGGRKRGRR